MPHLLPAAASALAAAAPAAASTAAATAAKATLMTTLKSVAFNALTNLAISAALSAFQPQVGQSGRTFEFVIDPDGPIPFAAGRVGVAGSVIHRDTFGPDLMYYGIPFVLSGAGPIDGIESFKADDYPMAFDANGGATTEPYRQELFFRSVLGHQPAPVALSTPSGLKNGATLPGWTSAHKLSGKAAGLIVMAENSKGSAFPTGEIKPLITFRGLKVYDPRLDSTYPGGSGSHRLNDPATWTYSANPILWALKWTLGLWEGPTGRGAPQVDYQVGGIGAKLSGIDVPAFVAAANVADANGWTVSAYPNTDDDKHQVLETFLQAGGAIYSQRAGKISCIQRAAPRTSIVTLSAADTAGPLEIDAAASRIDRINTLRPRFWSPAHRWQMTALDGEVTAATYREQDGAVRSRGIDYPYVSDARQAAQLAALQIAHTREGIAGVIPLKPHLQRIRPGDAFTITEPGFVLNGLKCLCLNTDYDPATGVVRVSFVSETDGKYPFALGQSPTPPEPQVLTPVDPRYVTPPLPGDWTITPRPPAPGGGGLPSFDLTGVVSNDTATAIIVEYGPTATGPWKQAYQGPPTVTNIPIEGLQPGATYYVAVQYQRNQNYSDRYVYGPYTAPLLDPSPNAPTIQAINADITAAFGDIFDVSALVSQARTDIDAQGVEIAAARGDQPSLNSRIVQVNQARINGDTSNAEAISLVQARTATNESDIIDLENALASETGARTEAINQVSARQTAPVNEFDGSDTSQGLIALPRRWNGPDGVALGLGVNDNGSFAIYKTGQGQAYGADSILGSVSLAGGPFNLISGAPGAWRVFSGERIGIALDVVSQSGTPSSILCEVRFYNNAGVQVGASLASFRHTFGSGAWTRVGWVGNAPGDGYIQIEAYLMRQGFSSGATVFADAAIRRMTFARLNANWPSNVLPAYAAPGNGLINATVTDHTLSIIDLETQQAIASWYKKADATGGKPVRLGLTSSSLGSFIALEAPFIYWGDNTVFDDATDTLQTTVGPNIRVLAFGAPFGASGNLLEWWGPSSVSLGAMTTSNGLNGRMTTTPYVFDNVAVSSLPRYAAGTVTVFRTTSPETAAQLTATGTMLIEASVTVASDDDVTAPIVTAAVVGVSSGGSETVLVSKDMGSGLPDDPLVHIFPPVQGAYPTYRVKISGSGPVSKNGEASVEVTLKTTPVA